MKIDLAPYYSPSFSINKGSTPLFITAQNGHADIVKILLTNHAIVEDGQTPLDVAVNNNQWKIVALFVSLMANNQPTQQFFSHYFAKPQQTQNIPCKHMLITILFDAFLFFYILVSHS